MNITRIMSSKGKITIKYEQFNDSIELPDTFTLQSADLPVPAFSEAFNAMKKHLLAVTELATADLEKLHMVGVDVKYTGENYVAVQLSGTRDVKRSKSGHDLKSSWFGYDLEAKNDEKEKNVMSPEMYDDLKRLTEQAGEYLEGNRSQQVLQFDAAKEEEPLEKIVSM